MGFNLINIRIGEYPLTLILSLIHSFLLTSYNKEAANDELFNLHPKPLVYDFIIVGGGASGCVLASRLSDEFSVLLIEAGGSPNQLTKLPKLSYQLLDNPSNDWRYNIVPQTHAAFALRNNTTKWPMGKGLGGSSMINGMIYLRGSVQGFNEYAQITKDPKWLLDNVMEYYRLHENYKGHFNNYDHGQTGKLSIEKTQLVPFIHNFLEAGQELGYNVRDPNPYGNLTEGFSQTDYMVRNGRRETVYESFLKPAMKRNGKNLKVLKFSRAYKILMDESNTAYGVEFIRHGRQEKAFAKKEVILSAGSIQSAKLLLLSGIGPKEDLIQVGIEPRVDLPVGENLQDKYGCLIGPFLIRDRTSFATVRDMTKQTFLDWVKYGKGTIATSPVEATFTITSDYAKWTGRPEDLDIHSYVFASSISSLEATMFTNQFNFKPEGVQYLASSIGQDSFLQLVTLSKPIGTGTLKLKSSDPFDDLLIDPKYLQEPRDVKVLIEGLKFATKVVEGTKSFEKIHGRLTPWHYPGCEKFVFKSDDYFECLARHTTLTSFKYSSTAPMGHPLHHQTVVDSRLKVVKTQRLRVIDCSVIQEKIVSINQATCMVIGRMGAEFIIEEWKKQSSGAFLYQNK